MQITGSCKKIRKVKLRNRMKNILFLLAGVLTLSSCGDYKGNPKNSNDETMLYAAIEIREENQTPTVDIAKYTLILSPDEDRKNDATEILRVKRKWPLAMQSPNAPAFDSLLSRDFTFTDDGHLFNRADYIKDRTILSEWKITHVKYYNLTLQFFGDVALLTYRNRVTNENATTKATEIEHMSWADVYVRENSRWKLGSAHVVDFRLEVE